VNHLHQLIECINEGRLGLPAPFVGNDADPLIKMFRDHVSEAVCFHMADGLEGIGTLGAMAIVPELIRLPYPVCWFETSFQQHGGIFVWGGLCFLASFDTGEELTMVTFWRDPRYEGGEWSLRGIVVDKIGHDLTTFGCLPDDLAMKEQNAYFRQMVFRFLSALNCVNVQRKELSPDSRLQRARAKRKKQPLFSTWTLELNIPPTDTAESQLGGTHAPPRLHLRRGHPRQYAPGKWCWVQPHVVGDKTIGLVHKDYAAKAAS